MFAVNSISSVSKSVPTARMISSQRRRISSVKGPRRNLGVKTTCAWRVWTAVRPLRISEGSLRGDTGERYDYFLVKIVVRVKLMPDAGQAAGAVNTPCTRSTTVPPGFRGWRSLVVCRVSTNCGSTPTPSSKPGLGAQAAQHTIKKVCHAYATLRANLRGGQSRQARLPAPEERPSPRRSASATRPRTRLMTGVCPGSTTRGRSVSGPPPDGSKTSASPAPPTPSNVAGVPQGRI